MKIVIAPQSFKGSLDAPHVAQALARGVRQVFPEAELTLLPVADGGEGTVRALVQASGGQTVTTRVMGPLGKPVNATWGILGGGGGNLGDLDWLSAHNVRIALQTHAPFSAAVQAVYNTLKTLREGTKPAELTGIASPELMRQVTRGADYAQWTRDFLGEG